MNEKVVIFDGENKIEEYEFDKEIDFSKLVTYLIGCDFASKIELTDKIGNKKEQEENLVKFVKRIIDDYNSKVEKFELETKNDKQ